MQIHHLSARYTDAQGLYLEVSPLGSKRLFLNSDDRVPVDAARPFEPGLKALTDRHPQLLKAFGKFSKWTNQLGTLGGGNHFIEVCLDESDQVWVMLRSGSRGIGNAIAGYFIQLARKDMERWMIQFPDRDLAYFPEGTEYFNDYVEAVHWAQEYAMAKPPSHVGSGARCAGAAPTAIRFDHRGGELPSQLRG